MPFAKQLSLFQQMLQTSDGCDLIITFNIMDWEIKTLDTVESLAMNEAIYLKLFVYGMELVLPFNQQIIALSMCYHLPQISRFALELLTKMNPAPRLTYLHLDMPSQTFREIQEGRPLLNRRLESRGRDLGANLISLSHLRYLEHVAINSNTCELSRYIPTNITHLEVIFGLVGFPFSNPYAEYQSNPPFHQVRQLQLKGIDLTLVEFLIWTPFPALEVLELQFLSNKLLKSPPMYHPTGHEALPLRRLSKLKMPIPMESTEFEIFTYIYGCPIRDLEFTSPLNAKGEAGPKSLLGFTSVGTQRVLPFPLTHLKTPLLYYFRAFEDMFSSMALKDLRTLTLIGDDTGTEDMIYLSLEETYFTLPSLEALQISNVFWTYLMNLLNSFQANELEDLSIKLVPGTHDLKRVNRADEGTSSSSSARFPDEFKYTTFPAVRVARFDMSSEDIRHQRFLELRKRVPKARAIELFVLDTTGSARTIVNFLQGLHFLAQSLRHDLDLAEDGELLWNLRELQVTVTTVLKSLESEEEVAAKAYEIISECLDRPERSLTLGEVNVAFEDINSPGFLKCRLRFQAEVD